MTDHPVAEPAHPEGAQFVTGLAGGLALVFSLVLAAVFRWEWVLIPSAVGAIVAIVCLGPWLIGLLQFKTYGRKLKQAQAAVSEKEGEFAEFTRVIRAFDQLDRADQTIDSARTAAEDAAGQMTKALADRDRVAAILRPAGHSSADFARALSERLRAFDRAFAEHPHFWWSTRRRATSPGRRVDGYW